MCFNLQSALLHFQSFTEKPVFMCAFAHPIKLFVLYLLKVSSYEMVSNAHMRQLTVPL